MNPLLRFCEFFTRHPLNCLRKMEHLSVVMLYNTHYIVVTFRRFVMVNLTTWPYSYLPLRGLRLNPNIVAEC